LGSKNNKKYYSWEKFPLWPHQLSALELARSYLNSLHKGSALIQMPTGTGKSGVIAVIARCFKDFPNVLIVVPWADLLWQLKRDVEERFWNKIKVTPSNCPKSIRHLKPSTAETCLNVTKNDVVFICTVQTLQRIYAEDESSYMSLKKKISLVLVDEGHREPAHEWAKAVRNLEKPTILFTATPYRNDLKMFNIDPRHVYVYSHQQAVKDRYIREVEFIEQDFADSPDDFVKVLLNFYHQELKTKLSDVKEPRVIVRCETENDVNDIASRLQNKGLKVIAVHDRFSDSSEDFRQKQVPDPEKTDAIFWVHQYKLIEGIDDPRFCLLAIYQPLKNARSLVQQVGRIIRNPDQKENQKAFVLTYPTYKQRDFWEGYRKFEAKYGSNPKHYDPRSIFDKIVQIQPELQYFEGNYRQRFDFKSGDLYRQFLYPRSANIYEVEDSFSLDELKESVEDEWSKDDLDVRKREKPDDETYVFTYVTYGNSPILLNHALLEYKIGFTIFRRISNFVFFFDSQGNSSHYLIENAKKVDPHLLQHLFKGRGARVSEISLMNMDLGRYSIRRKTLHARSLEDTAPGLVDYAHFVSTARGFTEHQGRLTNRYVGFTKARVSDHPSLRYEFNDYMKWLEDLASVLEGRARKSLILFNRFATFTNPPSDPTPINILLDVEDVLEEFETASQRGKNERKLLSFDDLCFDVSNGKFECVANSEKYTVKISYNSEKDKYILESSELEKAYVRKDPNSDRNRDNLIGYLNRTQSFRVVPKTAKVIYAYSKWYKPKLQIFGEESEFELMKILHPVQLLAGISTEKGDPNQENDSNGWPEGSLFHLIDTLGEGTELEQDFGNIDILVCDDMGTEIADFIATSNSEQRVVFIHAKAFRGEKKWSATAFSEVSFQAIKNLEFLHPYSTQKPKKLNSWKDGWRCKKLFVAQRIRRGAREPDAIWDEIRKIIRNPSSSKEVWLLLGQGFSLKAFKNEVKKPQPPAEIIQIIYSLQSLWSNVSSVGAGLRIYCSP